jgi:integrase
VLFFSAKHFFSKMKTKKISVHVELSQRANKDGSYALYLRCHYNGQLKREQVPFTIRQSDWNIKRQNGKPVLTSSGKPKPAGTLEKANWVKSSHPQHESINEYISERIQQIQNEYKAAIESQNNPDPSQLMRTKDFYEYSLSYVNNMDNGYSRNSRLFHCKMLVAFAEKSKHSLQINKIDLPFARAFATFLASEPTRWGHKRKVSSTNIILSFFRAVMEHAIEEGVYHKENPFKKAMLPQIKLKQKKKKLSIEQVNYLLEQHQMKAHGKTWDAVHSFLLCFFARGMRIKDCQDLKWENVKEDHILYNPSKGKRFQKRLVVPIAPPLRKILDRYKQATGEGEYVTLTRILYPLPGVEEVEATLRRTNLINDKLRTVSKKLEWGVQLTTHSARHSFIDFVYRSTGDIYKASNAAGHSSTRMTENYVDDLSANEIKETLEKLFN